jgi:hypothetical protein
MIYGKNRGCSFITGTCTLPQGEEFCDTAVTGEYNCDFLYLKQGRCLSYAIDSYSDDVSTCNYYMPKTYAVYTCSDQSFS